MTANDFFNVPFPRLVIGTFGNQRIFALKKKACVSLARTVIECASERSLLQFYNKDITHFGYSFTHPFSRDEFNVEQDFSREGITN